MITSFAVVKKNRTEKYKLLEISECIQRQVRLKLGGNRSHIDDHTRFSRKSVLDTTELSLLECVIWPVNLENIGNRSRIQRLWLEIETCP